MGSAQIPGFSVSRDGTDALTLRGELDMATAPRFVEDFHRRFVLRAPWEVRLNLSELTFVDLAGLRALVSIASIGGCLRVVLESPTEQVRRVFMLSGLDQLPRIEMRP